MLLGAYIVLAIYHQRILFYQNSNIITRIYVSTSSSILLYQLSINNSEEGGGESCPSWLYVGWAYLSLSVSSYSQTWAWMSAFLSCPGEKTAEEKRKQFAFSWQRYRPSFDDRACGRHQYRRASSHPRSLVYPISFLLKTLWKKKKNLGGRFASRAR